MKMKVSILAIVGILLLSGVAGFFLVENCGALGITIYVNDDGGADYTQIQDAINAASAGDTIYVYNGIYNEYIHIDSDKNQITVKGENKETTIINGQVDIFADSVTIRQFTIKNSTQSPYPTSIRVSASADDITINKNILKDNWFGIRLGSGSENCYIFQNTVCDNQENIRLSQASNNDISENIISNGYRGIVLYDSCNNNIISGNTFENNEADGIKVSSSFFINISGNSITNSNSGIVSFPTHDSYFSDNIITDCDYGICLIGSSDNDIQSNTIKDCKNDGINIQNSSNNNIQDNNVLDNNNVGIGLHYSSTNNNLLSNTLTNNNWGIYLYDCSSNNVIAENTIENNNKGIYFEPYYGSSDNNHIYHNYFIGNVQNAKDKYNNQWDNDYPSGGNYWDDYTGTDSDGDGIGDTPYDIPGGSNQDRYPLGYFNNPPSKPTNPSPSDGETDVNLSRILSVYASDPDEDMMDMYFYDVSDDSLIDVAYNVESGERATVVWTGTVYTNETYEWYAIANDSMLENISDTWSFTTKSTSSGNSPPIAVVNGPYSGYMNDEITFDGSGSIDTDGTIIGYRWDFTNDGTYDTGWLTTAITTHSYSSVETYIVKLQVKDDNDATDTDTATVTVSLNNPPMQSDELPSNGETGLTSKYVELWITIADDSSDNLMLYWKTNASGNWETIDTYYMGGLPADYRKSYVFPEYGKTYYWSVNLTDGVYWTNRTYHFTIKSLPPESIPPVADANGPYSGDVNISILFDGRGCYDDDGYIVNYTWNFGDGKKEYRLSPTHEYSSAGNYTVILTVTDNDGLTDSDMTTAYIIGPDEEDEEDQQSPTNETQYHPNAKANGPYSGYVNNSIIFNASDSYDTDGTIVSYEWDFGDGHTGNGISPTHTYDKVGNYTVTLVVTDNQSLMDSDATTVTILEEKPDETPGFELILVMLSIALFLFWKRRR